MNEIYEILLGDVWSLAVPVERHANIRLIGGSHFFNIYFSTCQE